MINSKGQSTATDKNEADNKSDVFINLNDIKALHGLSDKQEIELLQKVLDESSDVDKVKKLSQQILDIKTREKEPEEKDDLSPILKLVKKWAKKLEGMDSEDGIKIVASLLENQYKHMKDNFQIQGAKDTKAKRLKEIKTLEATLGSLPEFAQKPLKDEIKKQYANLPKSFDDTFEWKHVNAQDEVVKVYDQLVSKQIVGIQPMAGPVGMAYALRWRPEPVREHRTQEEVVAEHNESSGFGSMSQTTIEKFEDLLQHQQDDYKRRYYIKGINENEEELDKLKGEQVGLVIEQKEVVARTMKIKLGNREKANSLPVARTLDMVVYNSIKNLKKDEVMEITKDELYNKLAIQSEEIGRKTKVGGANQLITGSELSREFHRLNKQQKIWNVTVDPLLKKDEIILAYKGLRENDSGILLCPYTLLMPTTSIDSNVKGGLMTRFGMVEKLFGSENYYEVIKITDFDEKDIPLPDLDITEEDIAKLEGKLKG